MCFIYTVKVLFFINIKKPRKSNLINIRENFDLDLRSKSS